jgi:hypothetical protein
MSKMILFNSPKNVGKSKAIEYLNSKGLSLISAECKEALHNLTMTLFGVSPERYWEIYYARELKEVPLPEFSMTLPHNEVCKLSEIVGRWVAKAEFGSYKYSELTIREAMIYVSEVIIKPRWGQDWFGQERIRSMKLKQFYVPAGEVLFTDDSCAFVEELEPLIEYLGQENILLLRIHRDGFTFDGDSRNYIPDGVINNTVNINNNSTEQEFYNKVEVVVREFIDG